jgi:hypothetical protein
MVCSKDVALAYSDMRFNIPEGYSVIVSSDLMNGMLAFKYGDEKGRKYIAFSDITNDSAIDYGCPPGEFYVELFSPSGETKCNKKELDSLTEVLLKSGVTKIWKSSNVVFNYIEFKDDTGSSVFICGEDGRTVQVDSSFLTEKGYQRMFADILGR